jgi:hypothetical protein
MAIQSNFPAIRPSLLLDFANSKRLDPRVTFTRASTATYYDGVTTAKAEENLLLRSEEFDATWTASNATVSANAGNAPDGAATADLVYPTTTGNSRFIQQGAASLNQAIVKTYSVFAKASGMSWIFLFDSFSFDKRVWFDVTNGVVGTTAANCTASIVNVGGGWYRCVVTTSLAFGGNGLLGIAVADADNSVVATANGTDGVLLWGAQLEQRSAVTAYTPTTTQPITNYIPRLTTAPANVARFDHNPVTDESLGLLVEESRQNLALRSDDFANATWVKTRSSITSNTIVAPDGTVIGDMLVEDTTASNTHFTGQHFTKAASAITYTASIYAKYSGRNVRLLIDQAVTGGVGGSAGASIDVNLQTGAVIVAAATFGSGWSSAAGSVAAVGNGWYRITLTATSDTATNLTFKAYTLGPADSSVYTGDGYSGVYIWGAQLEAGAFATSYIPTVASAVTRSADAASMTGANFSSWYNQAEGTVFSEVIPRTPVANTNSQVIYDINDNTSSNRFRQFRVAVTAELAMSSSTAGTTYVSSIGTGVASQGSASRTTAAYKVNDFAVSTNGASPALDTVGMVTVPNRLDLGTAQGATLWWNGTIRKFAYYPLRLTDAQLQAITG